VPIIPDRQEAFFFIRKRTFHGKGVRPMSLSNDVRGYTTMGELYNNPPKELFTLSKLEKAEIDKAIATGGAVSLLVGTLKEIFPPTQEIGSKEQALEYLFDVVKSLNRMCTYRAGRVEWQEKCYVGLHTTIENWGRLRNIEYAITGKNDCFNDPLNARMAIRLDEVSRKLEAEINDTIPHKERSFKWNDYSLFIWSDLNKAQAVRKNGGKVEFSEDTIGSKELWLDFCQIGFNKIRDVEKMRRTRLNNKIAELLDVSGPGKWIKSDHTLAIKIQMSKEFKDKLQYSERRMNKLQEEQEETPEY
jgi:hypothetical protein